MSKQNKKILIIDGNAIIHRSFHALPTTIKTKSGEVVNAVYGFTSVLIKSINDFKPDYIALTLDKKGPTFRHEKYKEYKANREKAPNELYMQIPRIKEIAKAFNISIYEMSGFEADDLIGTICKKTENLNIDNLVVTGDMDLLQLVNKNTKVYKLGRGINDGILFNSDLTKSKYGILPNQVVEYKALRGDASDNIPGVPGIGDKTAIALLDIFGNIDTLYNELEKENSFEKYKSKITPRIINLLKEHKKNAYLSRELASIKQDTPIDFDLDKNAFGDFNPENIIHLFSSLEFKSLLPRIKDLQKPGGKNTLGDEKYQNKFERNKNIFKYHLINTNEEFDKFVKELKNIKEFTFDTETTSFDPISCRLLGISFSWNEKEAYYINFDERDIDQKNQTSIQSSLFEFNQKENFKNSKFNFWIKKLKPIFEDEKIKKCAHNFKYDFRVLKNLGINIKGIYFDTMIASYLINPGTRQHNLDALTFSEFNFEKISIDELLGTGKNKISFEELETEKLSLYSCEDADFTNRLAIKLRKKLDKERFTDLFYNIELPLIEILADMEENGIEVDKNFLTLMSAKLNKKILSIEKEIYLLAGFDFNIRSTKQLKEALFEKLNISSKGIKKSKTGFSTAFDELEKLKDEHSIIGLIQEHRELSKLTSTYIDSLPMLINKKTGRIHTHFNQTIAATGRLSSTDPNLQNIPVRTEIGRDIRKAFVSKNGFSLLAIDYSQIELRVAAHLSNDEKMIKAFNSGGDIHTQTASEIRKIQPEEVTNEMRREAKATNFGILYGQGAHGLSKAANISYIEAKNFIDNYFVSFPGIKNYIDSTIKKTEETGWVETMYNRRRFLPDINSTTPMIKKAAERMAINTPIQGSAADILKLAMIEIFKIIKNNKDIKLLLQVHDELVFEVAEDKINIYANKIKSLMENIAKLKVPLVADVKVGKNWGELYEFK